MYLSKVMLSAIESYAQHQAIWQCFPDTPDRKRDHLFRVESQTATQSVVLLQSATEPKSAEKAEVIQTKSFNPVMQEGAFYKFKLIANPTKCLSQSKKVVDIKDPNEQVEWLHRKLSGANVTVTSMDSMLIKSKKFHTSRFVCFEGLLQAIDTDQIRTAIIMGVGRKKHAGAGLLTLARA